MEIVNLIVGLVTHNPPKNMIKLELCAFALKGEHKVYSLVPNIHFRWHFWPFQINTKTSIFFYFFYKMAARAHFGCPKFTFDHISNHFRSILFILFFTKWPAAPILDVRNSLSHFWPFQIDTQLLIFWEIFDKMAAVGHFGYPKFTFDRISGHFRSILNFNFF